MMNEQAVGIDVSKKKLDVCVARGDKFKSKVFPNTAAGHLADRRKNIDLYRRRKAIQKRQGLSCFRWGYAQAKSLRQLAERQNHEVENRPCRRT